MLKLEIIYNLEKFNGTDIDRIIEMAWEDRTTFDAIKQTFGLNESEVISLMRKHLKISSFKLWRKRVSGRKTKHEAKRNFLLGRFKCSRQRNINQNKISKRNGNNRKSVRIRK
tara:strand:- start:101 stop:439 length:339 start_codon:yes stop_codon:yes gene_type:complete